MKGRIHSWLILDKAHLYNKTSRRSRTGEGGEEHEKQMEQDLERR